MEALAGASALFTMDNLFWAAYSDEDRHAAIHSIQSIVAKHGDIVDAKFFSDISLTLKIEIEARMLRELYEGLSRYTRMDGVEPSKEEGKKERTLFLNITFGKGTGDLKIAVPAVPG